MKLALADNGRVVLVGDLVTNNRAANYTNSGSSSASASSTNLVTKNTADDATDNRTAWVSRLLCNRNHYCPALLAWL